MLTIEGWGLGLGTMGFRCPVIKHAGKGMIVKTFQDGIFKLNHLLPNELFKWKKTHIS